MEYLVIIYEAVSGEIVAQYECKSYNEALMVMRYDIALAKVERRSVYASIAKILGTYKEV